RTSAQRRGLGVLRLALNNTTINYYFITVIRHNDLNMVRLPFQRTNSSIYQYVYLLLASSILSLSAKCPIFYVGGCFSL
ncbi:hypothetical protein, partial [uncultured Eudoraea sp.]